MHDHSNESYYAYKYFYSIVTTEDNGIKIKEILCIIVHAFQEDMEECHPDEELNDEPSMKIKC